MTDLRATKILGSTGEEIDSLRNSLAVYLSDVNYDFVNRFFRQDSATTTTIAIDTAPDDYQITVASAVGFAVGDYIHINTTAMERTLPQITNIAAAVLTLDRRLDVAHVVGDVVAKTIINLKTTPGTMAAPQEYFVAPDAGEVWHLTRLLFEMTHGGGGDLGKFGDIAAPGLANGVTIRIKLGGVYTTIMNWKTNADIKIDFYDVDFNSRAGGGGTYSTSGRGTLLRLGGVIRLDGDNGDRLEVYVQDDLTTLLTFEMKAQGHVEV